MEKESTKIQQDDEVTLPRYEDVVKTSSSAHLSQFSVDDVNVTFTYSESVASSTNSDKYVNEFNDVRNSPNFHVSIGHSNPAYQQDRNENQRVTAAEQDRDPRREAASCCGTLLVLCTVIVGIVVGFVVVFESF